jgi:hypothetical protein
VRKEEGLSSDDESRTVGRADGRQKKGGLSLGEKKKKNP